jgi:hypothetical protein
MAGRWQMIGSRRTFVPPFVNERFDGPPFWACTYTALLNGANVAWLGQLPATHAEVAKLAGASGDKDLRRGSRSSHMIEALRRRYKVNMRIESVGPKEARRRLANGYALVAGVTYGEFPWRYRQWSPNFKLGHRVTVFGLSGMRTKILDPLAPKGIDYDGDWIEWDVFANAWWRDEQLWFREGQFVPGFGGAPASTGAAATTAASQPAVEVDVPPRVLRRFDTQRHFRVDTGATIRAFKPALPKPVQTRQITFTHVSGALFDAVVTFDAAATIEGGMSLFLRVTNGAFAGRFVPWPTPGLSADISEAGGTTTVVQVAPTADALEEAIDAAILEARQAEWQRIADHLGSASELPPKPTA